MVRSMDKPFIGIANSWNEVVPGHIHLNKLVEEVKRGILEAGGVPFVFGVPAVCDGIAMAADVVKMKTAKTVQGQEVKIDAARWHLHRHVKVNEANIIQQDIVASNGVCHAVVDELIFGVDRFAHAVEHRLHELLWN